MTDLEKLTEQKNMVLKIRKKRLFENILYRESEWYGLERAERHLWKTGKPISNEYTTKLLKKLVTRKVTDDNCNGFINLSGCTGLTSPPPLMEVETINLEGCTGFESI